MRISAFQIKNYKCFRDTGLVAIDRQRTLIVGKNDSGKSSLLECLGTLMASCPHLSSKSKPRSSSAVDTNSRTTLVVDIEGYEIRDALLVAGFTVDVPANPEIGGDQARFLDSFEDILRGGP